MKTMSAFSVSITMFFSVVHPKLILILMIMERWPKIHANEPFA